MSLTDMSKHGCIYIDTVTFLVEDCLFKVPREPFETESVVFGDMFRLPKRDLHDEEGKRDDDPIHLTGIKKDDFEQHLRVLLHRDRDQWTSVLKLAILWDFDTIRQAALDHLKKVPGADRIYLGEAFDLDFESWLLPAMHEIVRRREPISVEEDQRMGLDTSLELASVREHVSFDLPLRSHVWEPVVERRPNVKKLDFSQILRKTFQNSSG